MRSKFLQFLLTHDQNAKIRTSKYETAKILTFENFLQKFGPEKISHYTEEREEDGGKGGGGGEVQA